MSQTQDKITIHATIDIAPATLQAIVQNAKKRAGTDEKGIYRVDSAETVNRLISAFLDARGFHEFISDPNNY